MNTRDGAIVLVYEALLLATLAGLWKQRRLRRLALLPMYLAGAGAVFALELIRPDIFFVWHVWAARELALHALTLGIVAEVAWRAFANIPGVRAQARLILALALLIPLTLVVLTPWSQAPLAGATWLHVLVAEVLPRLSYGMGCVCMALVWAMARRLVPSDPLHASAVLGLGCYLFVYAVALGRLGQGGPAVLFYVVKPVAYALLLAVWVYVAWRDEPTPDAPPLVRHTLQPWRH